MVKFVQITEQSMKKLFLSVVAAAVFTCLPANADGPEYLPKWEKGYLYIHNIGTGQGDCTFMVLPDGTTWMVDAGDVGNATGKNPAWFHTVPDNKKTVGEYIVDYYNHFSPTPGELDYFSLTHFHVDHTGSPKTALPGEHGYARSGITLVGDLIRFHKMVDRAYPSYDFPSREKIFKECSLMKDYLAFVEYQRSQGMQMERFQVGSKKQFALLHDPKPYAGKFEVRNIVANGEVWTGKGMQSRKMYSGDISLFDENMNSCGFLLRYGDFVYYNCGDLGSGNYKNFKSQERDFESFVADLCPHVTLVKPDHHGWRESSNAKFLMATRPEVFVFMASNRQHPYAGTMRRLADPLVYPEPREFYTTTDAARSHLGDELWGLFKPTGHIVVRVHPDGRHYEVFVLDIFSDDYRVIYHSGIKEVRVDGKK